MPEGGFFEQKRSSPTGLVIVVAVHAAALTALALAKIEVADLDPFATTTTYNVPVESPPPPERVIEEPPVKSQEITYVPPRVPRPVNERIESPREITLDPPRPSELDGDIVIPGPIEPPIAASTPTPTPPPLRREARMDARSVLQPPYPDSEQRAERQGTVTVRVLIGADGRVRAVEKVTAASDAFYRATERHALRSWRFQPATVDGSPVESRKLVTVRFTLDA